MSTLSLPAQAYLLACDTGRDRLPDRHRVAPLVRAAALTDLVLRGLVADDDGRPVVTGPGGTGHLVLDDLLSDLAADPHRKWRGWVRRDARATLQSLETQLDAAGTITLRTSRVLGLFPRRRPVVRDRAEAARLHEAVAAALRGAEPASQVDPGVAALTSLAAAAELGTVLPRRDRRQFKARLAELEDRAGAAVPALRKVVRELKAARTAAISAASSGGSGG
ncbi:GPP34 family phosphoprotein [Amycolatopsis sp. NPDC049252]|uniref:GOLPH3/VPS74 family protein n=1 Tax=Amycolatopsis sp. NPDC049252 TaxID=3363933 RepID=UPI00371E33BD